MYTKGYNSYTAGSGYRGIGEQWRDRCHIFRRSTPMYYGCNGGKSGGAHEQNQILMGGLPLEGGLSL